MYHFIANNWGWILLGWIAISFALAPFVARFCNLNAKREAEQYGPKVIDWDSDDWKDQTHKHAPKVRSK